MGKKSPAAPGLFRRSLFPGLFRTPPSPVELQKLLIAMLMKSGGCGERVSETLLEQGKFLFLPSSPSPHPSPSQPALCALPSPFRAWRAGPQGAASPSATVLCAPHSPMVSQPSLRAEKAAWEPGARCQPDSPPSGWARSGLGPRTCGHPANSGPLTHAPREPGALFPSHLSPVHLSVHSGEGAGAGDASQPPPPGGLAGRAAESGARRRQPLLFFAPALQIGRCSRRSSCRRLGCLGGRLRVT